MKPVFSREEWQRVNHDWEAFWDHKLDRPLIFIEYFDPLIPEPGGFHRYFPQYPKALTGRQIMEIEEKRFSRIRYFGDGFPRRFTNFGPGSMATYLGSDPGWDDNTVWFKPVDKPLGDIGIKIDRSCYWYNRVTEIIEAGHRAFGKEVVTTISDMGGNMDILASLRGSENLLYDLYDCPGIVEEKLKLITSEWLENYDEETGRKRKAGIGFIPWAPVYSPSRTTYMLQCDFSYMISPDMFGRFVMPDLEECCGRIDIPFYHLDGKGQIPHLDHLLSLKDLKGVQWIPGAGQPQANEWPDLLGRIRKAGKFVQVYLSAKDALDLKSKMGLEGFIIELNDANRLSVSEAGEAYRKLIS